MVIVVRLIGLMIAGLGVAILARPTLLSSLVAFFREGNRFYLVGALRLVLGAWLLLAAAACRLPGVVGVFGILTIVSGVLTIALGPTRLRAMADWWVARPAYVLQIWGVVAAALGSLLAYAA